MKDKIIDGLEFESHYNSRLDTQDHSHPFFELLFIMKGKLNIRIRGNEFLSKAGDMIVYLPGEVHQEKTLSKATSFLCVRFREYNLKQFKLELPDISPAFFVFSVPGKYGIVEVLNRAIVEEKSRLPGSEILRTAYFLEFFVLLTRAYMESKKMNTDQSQSGAERISFAIDLIKKSLDKPVKLNELADSSFLSTSYFSEVFKRKTGTSPKQFIIKEKTEKAKHMLKTTDMPLKQIAEELGYESESYFHKQFKKQALVTPMEYRQSHSSKKVQ